VKMDITTAADVFGSSEIAFVTGSGDVRIQNVRLWSEEKVVVADACGRSGFG
jgi:hypothetical protein